MPLPMTIERVPRHTADSLNRRITEEIARRVRYYAAFPEEIDTRLAELDREWDIERTLETNASALAFGGVMLGATGKGRWFILPALVTGFLLQHALQGWCPPIPLLRRFGYRTPREIEYERVALKSLRGDFGDNAREGRDPRERAKEALAAAQR